MAKIFSVANANCNDDQKTITIQEQVTETKTHCVTIATLKVEYESCLAGIERLKLRAAEIVDMLNEIDQNTQLEVNDIPELPFETPK